MGTELDIVKGQSVHAKAKERDGDVVIITSDQFSTGDGRLGKMLMKAFLNTLWNADTRPAMLMFINNGIKLTTKGSEVLETLRLPERDGI